MKDGCFFVPRQLHVAFNGEAALDRGLCRGQRILDDPVVARVEPAMGDRPSRQPGRCAHTSISNMPSTSTAASRGSCATPIVERAWRPRSPKTFMIRSDAPFMMAGTAL